jgi:hypothetical protein
VYLESTGLYADAVQRMVLDGLDDAGVDQLASLSFAILSKLDPDRRLTITANAEPACAADPIADRDMEADAEPVCAADPVMPV